MIKKMLSSEKLKIGWGSQLSFVLALDQTAGHIKEGKHQMVQKALERATGATNSDLSF